MLLDERTYLACTAVWDAARQQSYPPLELVAKTNLQLHLPVYTLSEATHDGDGHRQLLADLQKDIPSVPEDWIFNIFQETGEIDIEFSLPLNDDPQARIETYQLNFCLVANRLNIDCESGNPFVRHPTKYFQLELVQGELMQYHVYFKDELMTFYLRKTLMKILAAALRFTFNARQRTALISTLQVLKLDPVAGISS